MRANHVELIAKNPRAKPRHEHVNIDLYTQKTTESYCDFSEDCRCPLVCFLFGLEEVEVVGVVLDPWLPAWDPT